MDVRHPYGVLHSFSIKNIFYDKIDLQPFLFSFDEMFYLLIPSTVLWPMTHLPHPPYSLF